MPTRRAFIKKSLGYSVLSMLSPGALQPNRSTRNLHQWLGPFGVPGDPLAAAQGLDKTVMVRLPVINSSVVRPPLPFYSGFTGDAFPQLAHLVLPNKQQYLPGGKPPPPTEYVDLAVVGGGLAGLTTAYALREHNPVVFEYADRFGGNSRGETWNGTPYSMGGAYLIDPDAGPMRDTLEELGLDDVLRPYSGQDSIELRGSIVKGFWDGRGSPPEDQIKFEKYREQVQYYAFCDYPVLPTADGTLSKTVQDLDTRSLKDEITRWMDDGVVPELLAAAIQLYCYSSFNAGWEEVSAASGLNFLAAEEFDLWVYPGGLGQVSRRLWQRLYETTGSANLRNGLLVFDVRLHAKGVQLTYIDEHLKVASLVAKVAMIACPKKLYQWMDDNLPPERLAAMRQLDYRSYAVANVLINQPTPDDYYDLFLIHDGVPMSTDEARDAHRITDALFATWVTHGVGKNSVLTCYWPMPMSPAALHSTFGTRGQDAERNFRNRTAVSVYRILDVLNIPASAVQQIRLTRWAHAMPVSPVGFYNEGTHNLLRQPIADRIFFANQDNWALPAIETAMQEAFHFVPAIKAAIGG